MEEVIKDIDEWLRILSRELEELQEYQKTDEEFTRGYMQGMETQAQKAIIRLEGMKNRYKNIEGN